MQLLSAAAFILEIDFDVGMLFVLDFLGQEQTRVRGQVELTSRGAHPDLR